MRLRSMHAFPLRTKPAGLPLLLQTLMIIAGAFAAGGCGGQAPAPGPETNPDFLRLRLEAFDLAIEGARLNDSAFFEQYGVRLAEADEAGRALTSALNAVRYNLSSF